MSDCIFKHINYDLEIFLVYIYLHSFIFYIYIFFQPFLLIIEEYVELK